jgi:hypothetical protein
MPSTGGFRSEHITVHVAHDGTKYFSSDATGKQLANIERVGGPFTTSISWTIWNRAGHDIVLRIHRFRLSGADKCPVIGGDITGCEYNSLSPLPHGQSAKVVTAVIARGDTGLYDYEIFAAHSRTRIGNAIDPELQIDDFKSRWKMLLAILAALAGGALVWRSRR